MTPPQVADFIVRFVLMNTRRGLGIDPSCGGGVFLKALAEAGFEEIIGVDADAEFLRKLPIELKNRVKILIGDGLQPFTFIEGSASAVVGNPPFSAKYGRVNDTAKLSNFELGKGRRSQAIEILFLERFLQLTSSQGVIGIILPQGIFSALPLRYVRTFIMGRTAILGVISLPRGIFSNGTTSKTSILFAQRGKSTVKSFMGIANRLSELPLLLEAYTERRELENPPAFWADLNADSFEPEFYWSSRVIQPSLNSRLPAIPLGELLSEMRCGGTEYGEERRFAKEGIPFISAKTVTPLGIDFDRNRKYVEPDSPMDKKWAHTQLSDVLFVRVGVGCSGRAAVVVDSSDVGIADDWIYILRPKGIAPFYLTLFFYTKLGKMEIDRLKRGVGTVTIPQRLLRQILVPVPPESFQEDIETRYREMVSLQRQGYVTEARRRFEYMKNNIEAMVNA
jgi:type I restriction enzyme M protein